jgi:hypothetical protein
MPYSSDPLIRGVDKGEVLAEYDGRPVWSERKIFLV